MVKIHGCMVFFTGGSYLLLSYIKYFYFIGVGHNFAVIYISETVSTYLEIVSKHHDR